MKILVQVTQLFFKAKESDRFIEKSGFYDEATDLLRRYDRNWRHSDDEELKQCKNIINLFWKELSN